MAKRKKYTLEFVIYDKLAIERVHEDQDLTNLIASEDDSFVRIVKTGMSALELIKSAVFLSSALIITCCRMDDKNIPDN